MIVTAIEPYRKDKYRIYLNDAFAFVLYKGDLRHFDIAEGKDLSEEELTSIREEVLVKRAKMRAMNLLTVRDYTEDALRRKLKEGLYPDDITEEAIAYVKQFHYVDDRRYALSYIEAHADSLSGRQILEKLKNKGIDPALVSDCLETYAAENVTDEAERELEILKEQMKKKLRTFPSGEGEETGLSYEQKQKLFAQFYRRGFSISLIEKAYEQLIFNSSEL